MDCQGWLEGRKAASLAHKRHPFFGVPFLLWKIVGRYSDLPLSFGFLNCFCEKRPVSPLAAMHISIRRMESLAYGQEP